MVTGIARDALEAMQRYLWPGNVRELSNAIESAFTFSHSSIIGLDELPAAVVASRPEQSSHSLNGAAEEAARVVPIGSFAEAEREIISRALRATDGNKVQAAALLRISRKKLYAKIEKYGI
jgi:two-component system response regulator AtoC